MKTNILKRWIVTVAVMSCILCSAYATERPNIVMIIGDDISVDDFGCYGNPTIKTPNVDDLAAKGLRFTNAYLTTSQCSPTRCSLITGRYPHNTGAPELHMPLPEGQIMFPERLKKAGYYHQLNNLTADPKHRKVLEDLRTVMDQWQHRTGDTTPSLDQATPDRHDRQTGRRIQKKPGMRPVSGVLPGQTTGAEKINDPGPIKAQKDTLPNFVVIFCDDLGYGDVGWLGPVKNRTPNIDRMAEQGACFTDFYCTSGVCSPSRASLMTGCYPLRIGMHKSSKGMFVLIPKDQKGLNPDEVTIAEVLKPKGYKTACIGKWHLGDQPEFLPTRQGFDTTYGLPFSNDMGHRPGASYPLPLLRNDKVIEAPADQASLTQRYTKEAIKFIHTHKDNPFFLYLPHTMPHVPLHASKAFAGKSSNGLYGDAVEEIDWSTGQILETLKALGIDRRTLVVFTSDNGATRRGSNAPFSGHKARYFEGSMRMPCVMWWPGTIPPGTQCNKLSTTMDLLPTLADFAGAPVPDDRIIDGKSIRDLIECKPGAESPHEAFYYYYMSQLSAVRCGKWKLWLPLNPRLETWMGRATDHCEAALYDLETDAAEKINLMAQHPRVVKRLIALAQKARADIGDYQVKGSGQREPGWVEHAKALILR